MIPRRRVAALLVAALLSGCGTAVRYRTPGDRLDGMFLIPPVAGTLSSGFGNRSGGRHAGLDILAPAGTKVVAALQGIASFAGNGKRGYGNAVILDHGEGITTLYGHLATIRVQSGETVPAGSVIGTVGRSGNATTYHLHFELRVDGEAVDPSPYLSR
ncbi:MAG TPA: M23 family metallopeptidase [Candidatus Deferrimicrobium sp.]|nr:M23 family metallopeptidase [Candidatus Deferrimicrobium sp.]